jgi:hypothetical protein
MSAQTLLLIRQIESAHFFKSCAAIGSYGTGHIPLGGMEGKGACRKLLDCFGRFAVVSAGALWGNPNTGKKGTSTAACAMSAAGIWAPTQLAITAEMNSSQKEGGGGISLLRNSSGREATAPGSVKHAHTHTNQARRVLIGFQFPADMPRAGVMWTNSQYGERSRGPHSSPY